MAQWKPGPFDIVYDDKLNTNLRLLRSAADLWASRGVGAVAIDEVLAVLIHVFARRWSGYNNSNEREERIRLLKDWLDYVGEPELEGSFLGRSYQPERVDAALVELRTLLGCAARSWSAGNPEVPPTDVVMHDVAQTLFRHRLLHRPPPTRIDDCFGAS